MSELMTIEEFFEKYPDCPKVRPIEVLNLIMKKENALQILRGEKKVEFRPYSQHYYDRMMDNDLIEWANKRADEMLADGISEEDVIAFQQEVNDFNCCIRPVKMIHFHNYANSWYLDVAVEDNYQVAAGREDRDYLIETYDCHDLDEMVADMDKRKVENRPLFFFYAIGEVLETNLQ